MIMVVTSNSNEFWNKIVPFPPPSIEDAKQKSEYDKMIALAEKKKATVRLTINEMRYDFKKLLKKNVEIPDHLRLRTKVGLWSSSRFPVHTEDIFIVLLHSYCIGMDKCLDPLICVHGDSMLCHASYIAIICPFSGVTLLSFGVKIFILYSYRLTIFFKYLSWLFVLVFFYLVIFYLSQF